MITVKRHQILTDFIVLNIPKYHVVLGIDWLSHNCVQIDSTKRELVLSSAEIILLCTSSGGVLESHSLELNIMDKIPVINENEYYELNSVDIRDELHKISVVRDFPQVFPEDFPGIPPEREIVFEILLQPGSI